MDRQTLARADTDVLLTAGYQDQYRIDNACRSERLRYGSSHLERTPWTGLLGALARLPRCPSTA